MRTSIQIYSDKWHEGSHDKDVTSTSIFRCPSWRYLLSITQLQWAYNTQHMSFEPVAAAVPCQVGCLLSVVIMPTCSLARGRTLKKELLRAFTLLSMSELSLWRRHRSGDSVKVEYIKCQMSTQGLMALGRISSENECLCTRSLSAYSKT